MKWYETTSGFDIKTGNVSLQQLVTLCHPNAICDGEPACCMSCKEYYEKLQERRESKK